MAVTISTHMGHQVARQHNKRNPKVTDKEAHIRKDGASEVWLDIDPRVAYKLLFRDAVDKYNKDQKRSERKITDYYKQVCKDGKKHPVYETIAGVYPKDGQQLTQHMQKVILNEYARGWAKANPNLCMIGCYWHADEAGQPHIHVDYIPWSDGYKNGPERQAGLARALEAQGFRKQGRETAQMQWTRAENVRLESICKKYGLEVLHPLRGQHSKHIATKDYKYHKSQLEELRSKIIQASDCLYHAVGQVEQFKNSEDVFQWMEDKVNRSNGKTLLENYCDSQNLDYEYWVQAVGISPNPEGNFGTRYR